MTGKSEEQAGTELQALNLGKKKGGEEASDAVAEGMITRTEPAAGTQVDKNTTVVYYISTGKAVGEDTNVTIPSGLVGQSLSHVQSTLQDLGLKTNVEKQQSLQRGSRSCYFSESGRRNFCGKGYRGCDNGQHR